MIEAYYSERAAEYEEVYENPERQYDLQLPRNELSGAFKSRSVLEIACGTGYWTSVIARGAESVVATDINESVLAM